MQDFIVGAWCREQVLLSRSHSFYRIKSCNIHMWSLGLGANSCFPVTQGSLAVFIPRVLHLVLGTHKGYTRNWYQTFLEMWKISVGGESRKGCLILE